MTLLDLKVRSPYDPKKSDWHRIVVFGDLAAACARHLKTDMMIAIEGCLVKSKWKVNGEWRVETQVKALIINLCFHRASAEYLETALLLASEQSGAIELEEDED